MAVQPTIRHQLLTLKKTRPLAHSPDLVPSKYSKPYADMGMWRGTDGKEIKIPAVYYGQIANIDENMGRLAACRTEK